MTQYASLALVLSLSCSLGCGSSGQAADKKSGDPLRARPATQALVGKTVPKTLSYVGTLVAPRDAVLSSTQGGRVDAYAVEVGQPVLFDQILVKLGAAQLTYASQAALANAAQVRARIGRATDAAGLPGTLAAKASLELAEDGARRAEQLFAQGSLSDQELKRRRSAQASAEAQYAGALAGAQAEFALLRQLDATSAQANAALGEKTIRAPFAGVVLDRFVEVGQIAAPHAPLLRVIDPSELRVRFNMPQYDADKVALGSTANVRIGDHMLRAEVVRSTPGLVGQANARLVEASIKLPEQPDANLRAQLLPGAHLSVWLEIGGSDAVVVAPLSATLSTAGLARAWVVADDHLSERLLSVLRFEGDQVLVRAGLSAGEQIVLHPSPDFRIGEEVTK